MARFKQKVQPEVVERLEQLVQFAGISRKDLAEMSGKTSRTVYSWLSKRTFIPVATIFRIVEKMPLHNVGCSESWLLTGKGKPPHWLDGSVPQKKSTPYVIFNNFHLDYTYATLSEFFKQAYPTSLHLLVQDESYAPRLKTQTLLIAVRLAKSKYKENWEFGYLLPRQNQRLLPVDIYAKEQRLYARAFTIEGFEAVDIDMSDQEYIFPIINMRFMY